MEKTDSAFSGLKIVLNTQKAALTLIIIYLVSSELKSLAYFSALYQGLFISGNRMCLVAGIFWRIRYTSPLSYYGVTAPVYAKGLFFSIFYELRTKCSQFTPFSTRATVSGIHVVCL